MYKIYLSPSTQDKNFGKGNFGTEEYRMNEIANIVEETLLANKEYIVYKSNKGMSREEIINDSNHKNVDLHVAIQSYYGDGKGIECYAKIGDERSNGVAKEIYKKLHYIYHNKNVDKGLFYDEKIVELAKVKSSSVLVEIGCHDNIDDVNWIVNNTRKIGENIAQGIMKGIKLKIC